MEQTRRAVMRGGAAAAAILATLPANASPKPDPIFAAIEAYKRAERKWLRAETEAERYPAYEAKVATVPQREYVIDKQPVDDEGGFVLTSRRGGPTGRMYYAVSAEQIESYATYIREEHREAWVADRRAALAREIRRARREDAASGRASAEHARTVAYFAYLDAQAALREVKPTTRAGALALVHEIEQFCDGGTIDSGSWPLAAMRNLALAVG